MGKEDGCPYYSISVCISIFDSAKKILNKTSRGAMMKNDPEAVEMISRRMRNGRMVAVLGQGHPRFVNTIVKVWA